jgi:hypothetical protein
MKVGWKVEYQGEELKSGFFALLYRIFQLVVAKTVGFIWSLAWFRGFLRPNDGLFVNFGGQIQPRSVLTHFPVWPMEIPPRNSLASEEHAHTRILAPRGPEIIGCGYFEQPLWLRSNFMGRFSCWCDLDSFGLLLLQPYK